MFATKDAFFSQLRDILFFIFFIVSLNYSKNFPITIERLYQLLTIEYKEQVHNGKNNVFAPWVCLFDVIFSRSPSTSVVHWSPYGRVQERWLTNKLPYISETPGISRIQENHNLSPFMQNQQRRYCLHFFKKFNVVFRQLIVDVNLE